MTAYRVVDDHKDLDNIGSLTHEHLDDHVNTTPFVVVSGAIGQIPPNARFLSGSGVTITDGGPGATLLLTVSGSGGSGIPGGLDTQIQFNDGGVFGGDTNFTFNKTTDTLTVTNLSGSLTRLQDGSPYLIAGSNVTIATGSNGSITISSTGGGATTAALTSWMEIPVGDADGINMVYTLNYSPSPTNNLMFYVNGVLQIQGATYDYALSSNTIVMNYAPSTGSNLIATYTYVTTPPVGSYTSWMEFPSGAADGVNNIFVLVNSPNPSSALMFYNNGVLQRQGLVADYTISGSTITMNYVPNSGSNIVATYPY